MFSTNKKEPGVERCFVKTKEIGTLITEYINGSSENEWGSGIHIDEFQYTIQKEAMLELVKPIEDDIKITITIAESLARMKSAQLIGPDEIKQALKIKKVGVQQFLEVLENVE